MSKLHSGSCAKKCAAGEMCTGGKCATDCPANSTKCTVGGKDACVSTASDNLNCGACGKKCDSGYVCSAGKCDLTCTRLQCLQRRQACERSVRSKPL